MRVFVRILTLAALISGPSLAQAAPISENCPDTVTTTDREFSVTTDPDPASCLLYGNQANELNANSHDDMIALGWTAIDKDQVPDEGFPNDSWLTVTGIGAKDGTFTIDLAAWAEYDRLAIGFVVGGGQLDPKWAVFELPEDETAGLWSITPRHGSGMSHINLYGMDDDTTITEVPEPASLLLLGGGLTAAAARQRRRAKR